MAVLTYTFTNIAYSPTTFISWAHASGWASSPRANISEAPLYTGGTLCFEGSGRGSLSQESCINVPGVRSGRNGMTSAYLEVGKTYYVSYWAKVSSGNYRTQFFMGNKVDTDADFLCEGTVSTQWTRVSTVINFQGDSSGVNEARIDVDGVNGSCTCYFSGFLIVNLTASGLQSKSKAWCDDHLYWVPTGQTGTVYDYTGYYTGSKILADTVGEAPEIGNLRGLTSWIKNTRGVLTSLQSTPVESKAAFINNIISVQNTAKTSGPSPAGYTTCGVNKLSASNYTTVSNRTQYSDDFWSNGRSIVNTLIQNADAIYAQRECIQASFTYDDVICGCNSDPCEDGCENCCNREDVYCESHCICLGDSGTGGCRSYDDICGSYCTQPRDYWCCNGECGNCDCDPYDCSCQVNPVCSCNGVCSCNWV